MCVYPTVKKKIRNNYLIASVDITAGIYFQDKGTKESDDVLYDVVKTNASCKLQ